MLKYLEEVYIIFIWLITKRVLDRVIFVFQILLLSQLLHSIGLTLLAELHAYSRHSLGH